ncbi:flagellar biosynthesis regulator FlaF [Acuticoccus yangtzensis]|uniref:flagellar biosynthesis regulator FlaF n=1 Tax=Acuticoccus yangtzensis TaxID=1443441 RepID=UPI0009F7FD51|nr:flagellar biosynthesis regulator FlaF [Acuticoccus yangtzensis]ORE96388.1 flagellar biosynthesis regulatory protein FlaF [Stappia sp. 22II-S9-Z10]
MTASIYADVIQGGSEMGREQEKEAFDRGISLMEAAQARPDDFERKRDAARHVQTLWGYLIKDLSHPANDLSDELKGNLISIGLWVIRDIDAIISGSKTDWAPLIEINKTVREGLAT